MALNNKRAINLLLLALALFFCVVAIECGLRIFLKDDFKIVQDNKCLNHRYDVNLGWFPKENSKSLYAGSRTIRIAHNSRGFRDAEHIVGTKPRIVFLGDSFVWGYDVEHRDRFTEKLSRKLPDWSIYNLGVNGYSTDQEYLLLKQHYDFYNPNIVFLVFCNDNDQFGNSYNLTYGGYYKPYFVAVEDGFEIRGIPVPQTANYYLSQHKTLAQFSCFRLLTKAYFKLTAPPRLNVGNPTHEILTQMRDLVHARGGQFLVGLLTHDSELEKFLRDEGIPCLDFREAGAYAYPTDGNHWTPEGHTLVSEKIYDFLVSGNFAAHSW